MALREILLGMSRQLGPVYRQYSGDSTAEGFERSVDSFVERHAMNGWNFLTADTARPETALSTFRRFIVTEYDGYAEGTPAARRIASTIKAENEKFGPSPSLKIEPLHGGGMRIVTEKGIIYAATPHGQFFDDAAIVIPAAEKSDNAALPFELGANAYKGLEGTPFHSFIQAGSLAVARQAYSLRVYIGDEKTGIASLNHALSRERVWSAWETYLSALLGAINGLMVELDGVRARGWKNLDPEERGEFIALALACLDMMENGRILENPYSNIWLNMFIGGQAAWIRNLPSPLKGAFMFLGKGKEKPEHFERALRSFRRLSNPVDHIRESYEKDPRIRKIMRIQMADSPPMISARNSIGLRLFIDRIIYEAGRMATAPERTQEELAEIAVDWEQAEGEKRGTLIISDPYGELFGQEFIERLPAMATQCGYPLSPMTQGLTTMFSIRIPVMLV